MTVHDLPLNIDFLDSMGSTINAQDVTNRHAPGDVFLRARQWEISCLLTILRWDDALMVKVIGATKLIKDDRHHCRHQ